MRPLFPVTASKKINYDTHLIKTARTAALCWVFSIVQRKDRTSGGTAPPDDAGRLPGKPEQNAVPTKGDIMAIARAGNGFPPPADKHHILYVHTAVPSKGAAGFFYSTRFYFIPRHITKEYMIFITGVPAIVRVRFFCALMHPPYRGRGPPLRS